jgi:putative hydrolase of the HAD superfamily
MFFVASHAGSHKWMNYKIVLPAKIARKTASVVLYGRIGRRSIRWGAVNERPVIFDLFHTLVDPDDFRPAGFRRLEASAAVLGVDYAVLEAAWNEALPDLVRGRDSIRGMLRRVAHANGRPARTLDIAPAVEPLGRYQDLVLLHPRPEILTLLDGLAPRSIGLLTNCHDRDVEAWRQSPLERRVDHAVFSTQAHVAKPDLEAYEAILEVMDVAAADVVYVGNGGDNELAGAAGAGMGTIVHFAAFDDARSRTDAAERRRRSEQAHFTAASVAELADILS